MGRQLWSAGQGDCAALGRRGLHSGSLQLRRAGQGPRGALARQGLRRCSSWLWGAEFHLRAAPARRGRRHSSEVLRRGPGFGFAGPSPRAPLRLGSLGTAARWPPRTAPCGLSLPRASLSTAARWPPRAAPWGLALPRAGLLARFPGPRQRQQYTLRVLDLRTSAGAPCSSRAPPALPLGLLHGPGWRKLSLVLLNGTVHEHELCAPGGHLSKEVWDGPRLRQPAPQQDVHEPMLRGPAPLLPRQAHPLLNTQDEPAQANRVHVGRELRHNPVQLHFHRLLRHWHLQHGLEPLRPVLVLVRGPGRAGPASLSAAGGLDLRHRGRGVPPLLPLDVQLPS
mmetsp:Transcript_61950/g.195390  ORF Transcript_61950/g.195390 Transcript_61950/m.195390 type:complete len:338 (+) Transcript_61950:1126-2139(+)